MTSHARSRLWIGLGAIASLLMPLDPSTAQAQSPTLQVRATIGELCTVTSEAVDFGDQIDTEVQTDAEGSIDITCVGGTEVNIALGSGLNPGFGGARAMSGGTGGTDLINYTLYQDSGRLVVWAPDDQVSAALDPNDGTASVPVYGRIPSQGNSLDPGLYTDEVTITLIF